MMNDYDERVLNDMRAELMDMPTEIIVHVCGVPCDHLWDGPVVEFVNKRGQLVTCSKCGECSINRRIGELP